MAVPRKKMTRSRIGMRRSGHKIKQATWIEDKKSGELRRPHHIDLKSGMYRGRFSSPRPSSEADPGCAPSSRSR